MSKKDFDAYYMSCLEQTLMAQRELDKVKQGFLDGEYTQEQYNNVENFVQPIVNTLGIVSKIKFILDAPTNKKKKKKYMDSVSGGNSVNKDYTSVTDPYKPLNDNWKNVHDLSDYVNENILGDSIDE